MGTDITLSLNGIDIDWGKNRYWNSHHWLFPPGSITEVEYSTQMRSSRKSPGSRQPCTKPTSRLCHLGYSEQETKMKFDSAVARWNRTSDLHLSFADFRDALTSVDFASLKPADWNPTTGTSERFVVKLLLHGTRTMQGWKTSLQAWTSHSPSGF